MNASGAGHGTLNPPRLRVTGLDLSPLDTSVPSFRLHARAVLHEWGLAALAADAELVISELATNAIRAAAAITAPAGPPPVRLRLTERARAVQVEIWDPSDDMPEPGPPGPHDREGGRGLLIVAAIAHRHGAYRVAGGGKCTWAILTLPPANQAAPPASPPQSTPASPPQRPPASPPQRPPARPPGSTPASPPGSTPARPPESPLARPPQSTPPECTPIRPPWRRKRPPVPEPQQPTAAVIPA